MENKKPDMSTALGFLAQHPEIITEISRRLQLTYQPAKETEGNVCFAKSEALRPEFKESFNSEDLLHYILAVIQSDSSNTKINRDLNSVFAYPENTTTFWRMVEYGKKINSQK